MSCVKLLTDFFYFINLAQITNYIYLDPRSVPKLY